MYCQPLLGLSLQQSQRNLTLQAETFLTLSAFAFLAVAAQQHLIPGTQAYDIWYTVDNAFSARNLLAVRNRWGLEPAGSAFSDRPIAET